MTRGSDLAARGVTVGAENGRIWYEPKAAVPAGLVDRLRQYKAELLAILAHADADVSQLPEPVDFLAADWDSGIPWPGPTTGLPTPIPWGRRSVPADECPRCHRREYRDVKIHGGRSVRRDCRRCGRFISFPVWFGREQSL